MSQSLPVEYPVQGREPAYSGKVREIYDLGEEMIIVATDRGIFHKMHQVAPEKTLLEAPTAGEGATCLSCAHCPWMAMNGLRGLVHVLETGENEIHIDESIRRRAVVPLERMLEFAHARHELARAAGG